MATVSAPLPNNLLNTLPTLKDLLNQFQTNLLINLNCHHLGTIQAFNSDNQTANATINYQKTFFVLNEMTQQYDQQLIAYPTLVDCPVIFLGGGSSYLTFPVQVGDECLVLFNDRDMDNWFSGSTTSGVATPRLHSFSDGIILVGIRSTNNSLENFDNTRAVLAHGNAMVGVGSELIKIANNLQSLKTILEGLTAKIDQVLTTGSVVSAPGPVTFTGSVATFNPTIEQLLE